VKNQVMVTSSPKREGARSNNTLTYCMGLCNVVMSELLGQNITTDPFPHTSSLSIPVCILWSIVRHDSYAYKSAGQNCRNQRSHLAYKNCQRVQASWLQNTHQSSNSYWGLALHMCIIICLAKLLAQWRILTTSQVL